MNRIHAIQGAAEAFDSGLLFQQLRQRVARATESQSPEAIPHLLAYLSEDIRPTLEQLGFQVRLLGPEEDAHAPAGFVLAERMEAANLPTVLMYGHGDVVAGMEGKWRVGRSPWTLSVEGNRWYGRGTADNKGQHSINLLALARTLEARDGRLGFNVKIVFEMGEEIGSPGLDALCKEHREALRSDVFIASDGPRLSEHRPTLFLGSRGIANFSLEAKLREQGFHSGNWGGLLRNPATTLAGALACLVDGHGVIQVPGLRPPQMPASVSQALSRLEYVPQADEPAFDSDWGEPGFTPQERVFGWNTLEVLSMHSGPVDKPVNAIPPSAVVHCQLRFVVGTDWQALASHVRQHLDDHGFSMVEVKASRSAPATRLDPNSPWVQWAMQSIEATTGKSVDVLPNLGGTLPNEVFAETLQLPTLWVPHSYPGCGQHAPDEHLLAPLAREGLQIMAGLFWDLGEHGVPRTSPTQEAA